MNGTILYDTIMVIHVIHLSKSVECLIPRVNPNINCGLWMVMMYHCKFIDCSKCPTVVQDVDSRGDYALGGDIY